MALLTQMQREFHEMPTVLIVVSVKNGAPKHFLPVQAKP
jgi:hypothetical protein